MEEFLLFYFVPLAICVLASWVQQILDFKDPYFFAFMGVIPGVNWVFAAISCILLVGWIGIAIVTLPTTIKQALKKASTK